MNKDGSYRGDKHFGQGRKPKSIKNDLVTDFGELQGDLPEADDFDFDVPDIPDVSQYLTETQKDGTKLEAEKIFRDTYIWLSKINCENIVSQQIVEQYSMSVARWIQCERAISKYGLMAKHPTTKAPIASPFVSMSREYKKQVNSDWYQIYVMVRDNSTMTNSEDDEMEDLLD